MQEKKIYDAKEIQEMLMLGRSKTYEFLEKVYKDKGPFKVIKIGRQYRVFKESFDNWINSSG